MGYGCWRQTFQVCPLGLCQLSWLQAEPTRQRSTSASWRLGVLALSEVLEDSPEVGMLSPGRAGLPDPGIGPGREALDWAPGLHTARPGQAAVLEEVASRVCMFTGSPLLGLLLCHPPDLLSSGRFRSGQGHSGSARAKAGENALLLAPLSGGSHLGGHSK